jgi:hypothetical protein
MKKKHKYFLMSFMTLSSKMISSTNSVTSRLFFWGLFAIHKMWPLMFSGPVDHPRIFKPTHSLGSNSSAAYGDSLTKYCFPYVEFKVCKHPWVKFVSSAYGDSLGKYCFFYVEFKVCKQPWVKFVSSAYGDSLGEYCFSYVEFKVCKQPLGQIRQQSMVTNWENTFSYVESKTRNQPWVKFVSRVW